MTTKVAPKPVITADARAHTNRGCRRAIGKDLATGRDLAGKTVTACTYCKPSPEKQEAAMEALISREQDPTTEVPAMHTAISEALTDKPKAKKAPSPKKAPAKVPSQRGPGSKPRKALPTVTEADYDRMLALRAEGASWRKLEAELPHLQRSSSPIRKLVLAEASRRGVTA
jgi:hypothetical protein